MAARAVAANRDVARVAAEVADVFVRPLQGEALVPEAGVGGKCGLR